jgi:hypothetical protein
VRAAQVLTHYGNKANGNFLEDYGFVFTNNPQNEFHLPIPAFVTQHMGPTHLGHVQSLLALRNIANALALPPHSAFSFLSSECPPLNPFSSACCTTTSRDTGAGGDRGYGAGAGGDYGVWPRIRSCRENVFMKASVFPTAVCNLFRTYLLSPAQLCAALGLPPTDKYPPETHSEDEPSPSSSSDPATASDGSNEAPAADDDHAPEAASALVNYFVDEENEVAMYDLFMRCCDHWLGEYSSTMEEDEAFIGDADAPANAKMVRTLLYEEKRAIAYLRECFERMGEYVRDRGVDWEHVRLLDGQHVMARAETDAAGAVDLLL